MRPQRRDIATPAPGPGSAATLHLLPPLLQLPPQLLLLLLLLQEPQLLPELLLLPQEPPLPELLPQLPQELPLELLPQELPLELLPQPSLEELEPPQPPPPLPPPPPLEVQALQLPLQPLWSLELEQALSHESELLQLGPVQSQVGEAVQLLLLLLHASPQLTLVERGGSGGGDPPSGPGKVSSGAP
jgi:hypothetical protein